MKKTGKKVQKIIREDFDERLCVMVLSYTLGQLGLEQAASITDEDIESLEGNAMMTRDFVQALARTARRIAKECSLTDDIIPYIIANCGFLTK